MCIRKISYYIRDILFQRYKWTPEQAVNYMKEKRPHILMHRRQWEALEVFYKDNIENITRVA